MTPLTTTIAGSLPKPRWLATPDRLWAGWVPEDPESLAEAHRDAVRLAVADQVEAGIDVVTDGEQTRRHFVTTFIEGLNGVDASHRETVEIRRRYQASVPRVVGPVTRERPVYVEGARYLRSLTDRPIRFTLPGPMTMVDTLADHHYGDRRELAWVFAEVLNQEAAELDEAGVDVIQFDEPAFNVFMREVGEWGVETLDRATDGLSCTTAVHICYGYGIEANIEWKRGLGPEWRQYEETFPLLATSRIDQVSLEMAASNVPMSVLRLLGDKQILLGAVDVASSQVETAEDVAAVIRSALEVVTPEQVHPCTNCGMVPLTREVARSKMTALAAGARLVRAELTV